MGKKEILQKEWMGIRRKINEGDDRNIDRDILEKERGTQKQYEDNRIREAKYNRRYKLMKKEGGKYRYIRREVEIGMKQGEGIRALMRTRCGNMKEDNKYWLDREKRVCIFCKIRKDNWEHFLGECSITKDWFRDLGESEKERMKRIWSEALDIRKRYDILKKFWKKIKAGK